MNIILTHSVYRTTNNFLTYYEIKITNYRDTVVWEKVPANHIHRQCVYLVDFLICECAWHTERVCVCYHYHAISRAQSSVAFGWVLNDVVDVATEVISFGEGKSQTSFV